MPDTVNGPEGGPEWVAVDWRAHERNAERLRQRIFTSGPTRKARLSRSVFSVWVRTDRNRPQHWSSGLPGLEVVQDAIEVDVTLPEVTP